MRRRRVPLGIALAVLVAAGAGATAVGILAAGGHSSAAGPIRPAARAVNPQDSSAWLAAVMDRALAVGNVDRAAGNAGAATAIATGPVLAGARAAVRRERLSGRSLPARTIPGHWTIRSYAYAAFASVDFAAAELRGLLRGDWMLVVLQRSPRAGRWLLDFRVPLATRTAIPRFTTDARIAACTAWCTALTRELDADWSAATDPKVPLGSLAAGRYTVGLNRQTRALVAHLRRAQETRITDAFSQARPALPDVIYRPNRYWIIVNAAEATLAAAPPAGALLAQNAPRRPWPADLAPGRYRRIVERRVIQYVGRLRRPGAGDATVAALANDPVATSGFRPGPTRAG